jgi:hypothetical protein
MLPIDVTVNTPASRRLWIIQAAALPTPSLARCLYLDPLPVQVKSTPATDDVQPSAMTLPLPMIRPKAKIEIKQAGGAKARERRCVRRVAR